ncbi:PIN domain-containing protein [Nocardia tengchongensis]|uniref:PIN domain-containing protein n=1 Tax=Nocardia tengchongensis TaxID=2055889 RepID=UPI0036BE3ED8
MPPSIIDAAVSPLPGVDRNTVEYVLRERVTALQGVLNTPSERRFHQYLAWANEAARALRHIVRATDIDRLVLTRRYWMLQSMNCIPNSPTYGLVMDLLETELSERQGVIEDAHHAIRHAANRWPPSSWYAVADTSFYMTYPKQLADIDFAELLSSRHDPVHLLIPILVLDELDGLKRNNQTKTKARQTLKALEDTFPDPHRAQVLRAGRMDDEPPRGVVNVEIILDPMGHSRLPMADQELIDRAVVLQGLTGKSISFLTYDTAQRMRARAAGLATPILPDPS